MMMLEAEEMVRRRWLSLMMTLPQSGSWIISPWTITWSTCNVLMDCRKRIYHWDIAREGQIWIITNLNFSFELLFQISISLNGGKRERSYMYNPFVQMIQCTWYDSNKLMKVFGVWQMTKRTTMPTNIKVLQFGINVSVSTCQESSHGPISEKC